jgi:uncharacterized damage-inducible protein DinB
VQQKVTTSGRIVGVSTFVAPSQDPRRQGPTPDGELDTLREYLTNYRLTLELKCQDLKPEQLATRSVPPSTLSLLGLVRHMAKVEHAWFQQTLRGRSEPRLYVTADDPDADFDGAVGEQGVVDEAFRAWKEQIDLANAYLDTLTDDGLTERKPLPRDPDEKPTVRDILVHMIEEYARHCGHADLLRECIDGRTGQ